MKEEAYRTCLDPALKFLEDSTDFVDSHPHLAIPFMGMRVELRFLKMFFWRLAYWDEPEYKHLQATISDMVAKFGQTANQFKLSFERAHRQRQGMRWKKRSSDLKKLIKQFKPLAKEICILILVEALKRVPYLQSQKMLLEKVSELSSFIDLIQQNIWALLNCNIDMNAPVKQHIAFIQQKLDEFGRFSYPVNHSVCRFEKLVELLSLTRTWANHISCLVCLYWIDGKDENMASTMGIVLQELTQKTMPYTAGVVASHLEGAMIPQILGSYVDCLFQDLIMPAKNGIEVFQEALIFLLSFALDPPDEDSKDKELILSQIYGIINELPSLISSIHLDETKEDISEAEYSDFLVKVDAVKADVKEQFVNTKHVLQFNPPKTSPALFLDSVLKNLKNMLQEVNLVTSMKNQLLILQEKLAPLMQFLQINIRLQNEHEGLMDLWFRAINLVYYAAYVIKFCPARSFSMWYGIICLPNVIKNINLMQSEIKNVANKICFSAGMELSIPMQPPATSLKIEGTIIGFEEDSRLIIDYLIRGRKDLTIISISGMPGQGKTTLANKIYNDQSVQFYFHKIAWSYVSKDCTMRELLIRVLRQVTEIDEESIPKLGDHDLAERLWRSLRKLKYLIVMDDIWDVKLWRQVQGSFPDDSNGSRILFTTRIKDLASEAKEKSISHDLQLFSNDESWQLIEQKLSHYGGCPPELEEIGKQIATYCNGLPLAVSLIANLLTRRELKLELWNDIAENLKSHLTAEGCGNVIELSYKYLPHHLKQCFLYFGTFKRGREISAKELKSLWVAEGFIDDNGTRSFDPVANRYLENLVSQSLVVVTKRTLRGAIKWCIVHDLLYDLCLEKSSEEKFSHWADHSAVIKEWNFSSQKYTHHRLCIGRTDPFIKPPPTSTGRELPTSQVSSLRWSYDWFVDEYSRKLTLEFFSYFLRSFKGLAVFDLADVRLEVNEFPEMILSLVHLKYLALWVSYLGAIPPSIATMWSLETLRVQVHDTEGVLLPGSMWTMKTLRHIDIDSARLNLEDFEDNNSFAAYDIETLRELKFVYDCKIEGFLRKLSKLRELRCYFEEYHPMLLSMFGSLENLEFLWLGADCDPEWEKLSKFSFPKNLKELTMEGFELSWSAMSMIGKQLPNLIVLKLNDTCIGSIWELEDGDFSNLKSLSIQSSEIETINASECDPFPYLEQFVVRYCDNLVEIPSVFGEICTLNTIKVLNCPDEVASSARSILEQQKEFGNDTIQLIIKGDEEDDDDDENGDDDDDEDDVDVVDDDDDDDEDDDDDGQEDDEDEYAYEENEYDDVVEDEDESEE